MYKYYESTKKYQKTPKGVLNTIYRNQLTKQKRKGIKVKYTFEEFKNKYLKDSEYLKLYENWVKSGYLSDYKPSFDRIDNKKDYCPENCRWETQKKQSNHRTNNVFYTFNGETKTSKQWCDEYNINQTTFIDRLKRGWTLEQALTISTNGTNRKVNI